MQSCSCPHTTRCASSPNACSGTELFGPCGTLVSRDTSQTNGGTAVSFESRTGRANQDLDDNENAPVLVHENDVEPVVRVLGRTVQVDPPVRQLEHEPVVPNVTHPIQRQLGLALLEQDWFHLQAVFERFFVVGRSAGKFHPAEIVDQARGREDVECAEGAFLQGGCSECVSEQASQT